MFCCQGKAEHATTTCALAAIKLLINCCGFTVGSLNYNSTEFYAYNVDTGLINSLPPPTPEGPEEFQ